jgi:RimJ/RimL family protein N-acetyltransferase
MQPSRSLTVLMSAAKLYTRPIRKQIRSLRGSALHVRLGPVRHGQCTVVLRPPRLADAPIWRAVRLRDQQLIEPFWLSSTQSWTERHTDAAWAEEVLRARQEARAGRALSLVVEVDGKFAGQLALERIDSSIQNAEIGVWIDSNLAGRGIILAAGNLLGQYAFGVLGLRRVSAPICVDNLPALRAVKLFGMCREGTMISFLDVGGQRKDHDLWAITSEMWSASNSQSTEH